MIIHGFGTKTIVTILVATTTITGINPFGALTSSAGSGGGASLFSSFMSNLASITEEVDTEVTPVDTALEYAEAVTETVDAEDKESSAEMVEDDTVYRLIVTSEEKLEDYYNAATSDTTTEESLV